MPDTTFVDGAPLLDRYGARGINGRWLDPASFCLPGSMTRGSMPKDLLAALSRARPRGIAAA